MTHSPPRTFRIFNHSPLEAKDECEEKLESCHSNISALLTSASSERERHDLLTSQVSRGNAEHDDVCLGLFAVVLVDRQLSPKATQDLMMVNRDSLNVVLSRLNLIILEKFSKLEDGARGQILWFMNELVKTNVLGVDGLFMSLMKQIVSGDTSAKNVWLAENIIDVFMFNRSWVDKFPMLIQMAVFTYLRVIQDHFHHSFAAVRQKEVNFCVAMLRDHWNECRVIGRDLVRLLVSVARIPEFEKIWSDILYRPLTLSPNFTDLASLLQTRTSRKFIVSRLTPDMETKVGFLLMKVRFGQQKRYQEWFQKQYLSTPESQSLRSDLIRYICGCVHPSNEILCSDIVQRWAVIGWLLSTCTSRVASSYSHMALFWDWLFYSPDKNSVMDIEPGVLVMFHSLRNHPAITTTLLDFLCRTVKNFHPPLTELLRSRVSLALRTILEKRVLPSLAPLFDNPKFDPELLVLLRTTFPEFCSPPPVEGKPAPPPPLPTDSGPLPPPPPEGNDVIGEVPMVIEDETENGKGREVIDVEEEGDSSQESLAIFSDEEETEGGKHQEFTFSLQDSPEREPKDISEEIEKLDETLKDLITQMQNSTQSDTDEKCERVSDIVDHLMSLEEFDSELCTPLATCLVELFSENFKRSILSEEISDEYLVGCVELPLYVIFRKLCLEREEDDSFGVLLSLLAEMYTLQQRLGYHLLFYLAVRQQTMKESNWSVYESFAQSTQLAEAYSCLMMDMKHCQDDDINMLVYLVPHIFSNFPEHCIGNEELLNMIVAVLDSQQLLHLQCLIMKGELTMMKRDSVLNVLNKSLQWETFEQYCTWQIFYVHDIPVEVALPLLSTLSHLLHPEALSMMLLLLKNKKPTLDMVKHMTARQYRDRDNFATSILRHWAILYESELTEHMCTLLNKSKPRSTPPRKGLRQSVRSMNTGLQQSTHPTTIQLLTHLDELRKVLPIKNTLLSQDSIIASLMYVQPHCDESDKSRFSNLFSIVEDSDDEAVVRDLRPARKRTKSNASSRSGTFNSSSTRNRQSSSYKDNSDSGSDSSSDDEPLKRKKKRAKKINDSSDSDCQWNLTELIG